MYLSRLFLDPRSRQVQREIADVYQMHRTIMRAFPDQVAKTERVLFRLDIQPRTSIPVLLVQSQTQPNWSFLLGAEKHYLLRGDNLPPELENPSVKQVELKLHRGQVLVFRLRANPTVKKDRPGREQGRRVGLYRESEQREWLRRKLAAGGAELLSVAISNETQINAWQDEGDVRRPLRFLSVQFDGLLRVQDPDQLLRTVQRGVGSGKGFGFGLLSLALPPREG